MPLEIESHNRKEALNCDFGSDTHVVCRGVLKLRHDILFGEPRLERMPRYRLARQASIMHYSRRSNP